MVTISQTAQQKDFLDYQWKSPNGELKDKISYVQLFPEWNWVLGSGILVADIQMHSMRWQIKEGMVAVVLSGLLFAMFAISNNIMASQ